MNKLPLVTELFKNANISTRSYHKAFIALMLLLVVGVSAIKVFANQVPNGVIESAMTEAATVSFSPSEGSLPPDLPVSVNIDAKSNKLSFARVVILFDHTKVQLLGEAEVNPEFSTVVEKTASAEANTTGKLIVVAGTTPPSVPPSGIISNFVTFTLTPISTEPNDPVQLSFDTGDMQLVKSGPATLIPLTVTSTTYILNPVATFTPTPLPLPTETPTPTPVPTFTPTPTPAPTNSPTPAPVVDTVAPSVSVTNPVNGAIVPRGTTYLFQASASDNVGVTRVEFYINGKRRCTDLTSPYECSWATPGGPNQSFTIQARAFDVANNTSSHQVTATTSN